MEYFNWLRVVYGADLTKMTLDLDDRAVQIHYGVVQFSSTW